MNEIELRFHVPADQLPAVHRWLDARRPAERLPLAAIYFDTADRTLARAGIGLRLRQEGPQWVQTCKGPAEDGITRLEHNAAAGTAEPQLDLSRHAGHPLGERLAALGERGGLDLRPVFETRIERAQRASRVPGAQLELALDVGELRAGEARLPVHELELELAGGDVNALLAYAHGLVTRLPLSLDLRSKAERGENLARGLLRSPPRKAKPLALRKDMTAAAALRALLLNGFDQVAANASQIGSGDWTDEHLHQLRVGLRRLKSGLRLFRGLGPTARHPAWPAFEARATALLKALGPLRDAALQPAQRWPALAQALAEQGLRLPAATPGPTRAAPALALVRAPQTQQFLLEWLGWMHWLDQQPADATPWPLRARLRRWRQRLQRQAQGVAALDAEARHALRLRLKRLRYGLEWAAGLYKPKALARRLKALAAAQDQLGELCDLELALAGPLAPGDAAQALARGWLLARRQAVLALRLPKP
ncbi:CYTH and CHAD domain-containing protein [Inhella proteolytica]|uniref:CHAD domain-containing protein n=1 Tax=Inhella proteolytica TaxID=2795029 RepID=A0A931NDF8_9BURK|nr:CYTH and CHAD domain-containing protein [Inhella proteolytica]MBH9576632.1 CHAD domain-containing protein [Inhella proteolytica]